MQFKHPEILYALFLLIIPIIVHLFQLQRFVKVPFTNVKLLKTIEQQTRKSKYVKKWLILITRLLIFTTLIFAFAQPYFSEYNAQKVFNTAIYLDNSYSMQAKGEKGELLKSAVQNIIENSSNSTGTFSLITNNKNIKELDAKSLKDELLALTYYPIKIDLPTVLLKAKNNEKTSNKAFNRLILISDFQDNNSFDLNLSDENTPINFVKLTPKSKLNSFVDSVYISKSTATETIISVRIKNTNLSNSTIPVSLVSNAKLLGKTTANFENSNSAIVQFTIPETSTFNGKISITDDGLTFDNDFCFSISTPEKVNVLCIGTNAKFLSKIYTNNEFNYTTTPLQNLNYNNLQSQQLIILNELETIPIELTNSLLDYSTMGGNIVIIPSNNTDLISYNSFLETLAIGKIIVKEEKIHKLTSINYEHPLLKDVFEKRVDNFQYPTIQQYFITRFKNSSNIIQLDNSEPYISSSYSKNGTVFWIASSLDLEISDFTQSPIVVPVFYNFAKSNLKTSNLYYTIASENTIDILTSIKKDNVVKIATKDMEFIPLQKVSQHKVTIELQEQILQSGFYSILNADIPLKKLAFNYNTEESNLNSIDLETQLSNSKNATISKSIATVFNEINNDQKINWLFKWFLAFSVLFLLIEMLILKYFNK
ncbi:MAG: hypothetical protein HKP59_05450 [Lutibacter sp.]|uniref:BatA domain-containing protein n=1 Tax=Lutibacter sp. TaxID=1925666 RepID=UPI0017ED8AD9|nr:BatA domain-containing protein [Lutibacter sp.]MBT8317050.1 BatA domain-containing protein [Lutibacter sp.]NNJ57910.1 hypothetical protein [Lutibacter sp.]